MRRQNTAPSFAAWLLLALSACACAAQNAVAPPLLSGSFSGQTADGQPVRVSFAEADQAFRGEGVIGDDPIVVAGAVGWRGTASLVRASGRQALVTLELSSDGEQLQLRSAGSAPLLLVRGGTSPAAADGPLSGRYRARKDGATLAQVTLVQRGMLLAGVAIVAGEAAGISGSTGAESSARGFLTFVDGSQIPFALVLAGDGRTLNVDAFGQRLTLEHEGAP
jgi:hypothetical protein